MADPPPRGGRPATADDHASASRHPLLAVVGVDAQPRANAPPAATAPGVATQEPPPPSVWDRLTDQPREPKPLRRTASLEARREQMAADYDQPVEPKRAGAVVWLGWIVSLVIWGLVVWAAYAYRFQLMDAWPPIRRLYAAFGLGPGS